MSGPVSTLLGLGCLGWLVTSVEAAPPRKAATVRRPLAAVRSQSPDDQFEEDLRLARELAQDVASPQVDAEGAPPETSSSSVSKWRKLHEEWLRSKQNKNQNKIPAIPIKRTIPGEIPSETAVDEPGFSIEETPATESPEAPAAPPMVDLEEVIRADQARAQAELLQEGGTPRDGNQPLPPLIRDPNKLQKVTDIAPYYVPTKEYETSKVPEDQKERYVKFTSQAYAPREMTPQNFGWEPTNNFSQPLYFEDPALERYGHHVPYWQPFWSTAQFSGQLALLPYQMALHHPRKKMYNLGWYTPGDYAPYHLYQIPGNRKAAAAQGAAILIPGFVLP